MTVKSVGELTVVVQESVAVCGDVPRVTLAGRVQVRPAGVEADEERFTVPVKPLRPVTVMVEVPDVPEFMLAGETAPADIPKSTTWKRIVPVSWDSEPLVPVTVTV